MAVITDSVEKAKVVNTEQIDQLTDKIKEYIDSKQPQKIKLAFTNNTFNFDQVKSTIDSLLDYHYQYNRIKLTILYNGITISGWVTLKGNYSSSTNDYSTNPQIANQENPLIIYNAPPSCKSYFLTFYHGINEAAYMREVSLYEVDGSGAPNYASFIKAGFNSCNNLTITSCTIPYAIVETAGKW